MKKISKIGIIMIFVLMMYQVTSNAGLQANKDGKCYTALTKDFVEGIRNMEVEGGTLGKNATLGDDFVDTSGNGIDSHLSTNNEWGTAAMMSASIFGNVPMTDDSSTTGNDSGIFQMSDSHSEAVAAGRAKDFVISNLDSRYYEYWTKDNESRPGDATAEVIGWYGAQSPQVLPYSNFYDQYFCRDRGHIFQFCMADTRWDNYNCDMCARAVVVCGEGL